MPRKPTPELSLTRTAQIFQMLGDETRLRILIPLDQKGKLTVTQLCQALGQSQPATSHHGHQVLSRSRLPGRTVPDSVLN